MLIRDYQWGDDAEVLDLETRQVIARIRLWPRRVELDAKAGYSVSIVSRPEGDPPPEYLQSPPTLDKIIRK